MSRFRGLLLGLAALAAGPACTTTELKPENTWQAGTGQAPVRRVLVVGMSRDEKMRARAEEALAKPLARAGVEVHRGSEFSPTGRDLTPDRLAEVVQLLQPDAVLFNELRGVAESQQYEPGTDSWLTYYRGSFKTYFRPGYHGRELVVRVSTEVFGASPGEGLLWSTLSEAFDPTTPSRGIGSAGKSAVRHLDKAGLL